MPEHSNARKTNLSRKPKQARSRQSLSKMLQTAKQMLTERGYADFTLQELSQRSEVSIGSIYHRFENKQELVRQVQAEVLETIENEYAVLINQLRRQSLPLKKLMPNVVKLYGNHLKLHAPILRVFMEIAPSDPAVAEIGRKYLRQAMLDFKLLLLDRRAEISQRDPEHAVEVCFEVIYSSMSRYLGLGNVLHDMSEGDWNVLLDDLTQVALLYLSGCPKN